MEMDCVTVPLDGTLCRVFFFESWATYSHPVEPRGPLYLEQAVRREAYYRAWMGGEGDESRFLLFEAIKNERREVALSKPAIGAGEPFGVYRVRRTGEALSLGEKLSPSDIVRVEEYFLALPDDAEPLCVVCQSVVLSYRYEYDAGGALRAATITNPEGKVNRLEY